ncbi:MAG: hypothetical protein A2045_02350 [Rhodocyclales bacterium GWA2_65_20]|nr:MAG: hypothetical protein A2045_02350 [Rhodocyclales bacterium GWA2_65_20]
MFYIKKLLAALILPPAGPVLLAFVGLWLARRHPRLGRGTTLLALLILLALSLSPVADSLKQDLEKYPPITEQSLRHVQAIVILGGGNYDGAPEYGGDTVGGGTLVRVRYGVYLQRHTGLPILVTGGAPYGGRPEGETMKEAIERDFHGKVRWVENRSRDTAENAAFSAELLKSAGIGRIALVSHASHLPRAVELFEQQGLTVMPAPTGYSTHPPSSLLHRALPSADALGASTKALREWLGQLAGRLGS